MSKTEYRKMRRLIRDNGRSALNWMDAAARAVFERLLFNIQDSTDWLAERADIVAWCKREGKHCNPRQTGRLARAA